MRYKIRHVIPKARPRFKNGRAYLPQNYRDWMQDTVSELLLQPRPVAPIDYPVEVEIMINAQRGDLDNLAGAVLDALVNASILEDDRCGIVQRLVIQKSAQVEGASILLRSL